MGGPEVGGRLRLTANLDEIPLSATEDDPIAAMRSEINMWLDNVRKGITSAYKTTLVSFGMQLTQGQVIDDPLFESMVRDFVQFDEAVHAVSDAVESFLNGIYGLCDGMANLSEVLITTLGKSTCCAIASDSCKFKEVSHGVAAITRADAPHSVVAKLVRDLRFNIADPLKAHMHHNRKIKNHLENRRRRLRTYVSAKKSFDALASRKTVPEGDSRRLHHQAKVTMDECLLAFKEVDAPLFEWLLMLEEYKGDIYDSMLQTVKYLQYEFFAASAHCLNHVLPKRMEFRPMIEMTPAQLRPQVETELREQQPAVEEALLKSQQAPAAANVEGVAAVDTATNRLLNRSAPDCVLLQSKGRSASTDVPKGVDCPVPVDPISLAILTSQGFESARCKKALQYHKNELQEALDCLITDHVHEEEVVIALKRLEVAESVRLPSTLKWVDKTRKAQQQHHQRQRALQGDARLPVSSLPKKVSQCYNSSSNRSHVANSSEASEDTIRSSHRRRRNHRSKKRQSHRHHRHRRHSSDDLSETEVRASSSLSSYTSEEEKRSRLRRPRSSRRRSGSSSRRKSSDKSASLMPFNDFLVEEPGISHAEEIEHTQSNETHYLRREVEDLLNEEDVQNNENNNVVRNADLTVQTKEIQLINTTPSIDPNSGKLLDSV